MPYRLSVTSNLVSEVVARAYETLFGLKIPEWRLIAVAAEEDGVTQQAIGARTRMDKVTVSRAVAALSGRGLMRRDANDADRRSRRLTLTPLGRELYAVVAPKALELEQAIFGQFAKEELEEFRSFLAKVEMAALRSLDQ